MWIQGIQSLIGFGLAAWLLVTHLERGGEVTGVLLLVYWTLNLPALGQQIAMAARQYPAQRNITLRLLEPLGAPEESFPEKTADSKPDSRAVGIEMSGVHIRAAGHSILEDVTLTVPPGKHLAVVGPSGAGKSSLVGLLLGWHRPARGGIRIDGENLDAGKLEALRNRTAWVDPAIQLWNRSLLDNLRYGSNWDPSTSIADVIDAADLRAVLEKMPLGLQTPLGEGGALVSGGEGQRVRLGRSLVREGVGLVILDEPFRGLDREQRRTLLKRAREYWKQSTLICVTHDVGETQDFERVLVVEGGRIVEDGVPAELIGQPDSRYRTLLDAEEEVRRELWSGTEWRHLWLERGNLSVSRSNEGSS